MLYRVTTYLNWLVQAQLAACICRCDKKVSLADRDAENNLCVRNVIIALNMVVRILTCSRVTQFRSLNIAKIG